MSNDLKTKLKTKQKTSTVQIFFNLQKHPIFHPEKRLVSLQEEQIDFSVHLDYESMVNSVQHPAASNAVRTFCSWQQVRCLSGIQ